MLSKRIVLLSGSLLALAACGGGDKGAADTTGAAGAAGAGASAAAPAGAGAGFSTSPLTPDADGKVITVQMETDEAGTNKFDPAEFEAHPGDVIRYTLKSGVHNVHFVADSNAGKTGFPGGPSAMLQLPGQTIDVKVDWAPGTYYYQCDPHALLGMIGRVKVEAKN